MQHKETTLQSEEIFKGHVIRVTLDTVRLENGATAQREIVHHHGGACVLALTEQNEVYLVRQFRYAFGAELWELPAGKLEPGEDPLPAAVRELAEECGVTADTITPLGEIYPTVGYDSEIIYLYAATGLHTVPQHLDADEFLDVVKLPFDRVVEMILNGEIQDSKTVAGVLKWKILQGKNNK